MVGDLSGESKPPVGLIPVFLSATAAGPELAAFAAVFDAYLPPYHQEFRRVLGVDTGPQPMTDQVDGKGVEHGAVLEKADGVVSTECALPRKPARP